MVIHDRFRGVAGVFGLTLDALQAAIELGLKVQINTTVTGHNLTDLADIAALLHRLGAVSWSAFLLVPTGRGALLPSLTALQAEDVLNFVYDAGEFIPARTTEAHQFRRIVIQREILRSRGADHVAELGLGQLYLSLRERPRRPGPAQGAAPAGERQRRTGVRVHLPPRHRPPERIPPACRGQRAHRPARRHLRHIAAVHRHA